MSGMKIKGRIMAIDAGQKHIGIALSDPMQIIAQPYSSLLTNQEEHFQQIRMIVEEKEVTEVIIGMPYNAVGEAVGSGCEAIKKFSAKLKTFLASEIKVKFWDESYTTMEAEKILAKAGVKAKSYKEYDDKLAASLILADYLEHRS